MSHRQRGFTLIELLIIVQIIGIIGAIAVPNLLASRRSANGASAVEATRLFHNAEKTYQAGVGNSSFGSATDLFSHDFIDGALAAAAGVSLDTVSKSGQLVDPNGTPGKSGYYFGINFTPPGGTTVSSFTAVATPSAINRTGDRSFFVDETGVIRISCVPPKKIDPLTGKCEPEDDTYIGGIAIGSLVEVAALSDNDVLQRALADPPDPDTIMRVLGLLDGNGDQMLTLREVLAADIPAMARKLSGPAAGAGKPPKVNRALDQILQRFSSTLERELALGVGNEEEDVVPLSKIRKGNPMLLLEMAARHAAAKR